MVIIEIMEENACALSHTVRQIQKKDVPLKDTAEESGA